MSARKKTQEQLWVDKISHTHYCGKKVLRDLWKHGATKDKRGNSKFVERRTVGGHSLGKGALPDFFIKQRAIYAGNALVTKFDASATVGNLVLTWDDDQMSLWAERVAARCSKLFSEVEGEELKGFPWWDIQEVCDEYKIDLPAVNVVGNDPRTVFYKRFLAIQRTTNKRWWLRQARKKRARSIDNFCRREGMVHVAGMNYCSDEVVRLRVSQLARNRSVLESMEAENDAGDKYSLAELAALSPSNPVIRRHELMTRMSGFEEIADANGHVGVFFTMTCPSAFHPRRQVKNSKGVVVRVEDNPLYENYSVADAQKYLTKQWSKVRAKWNRDGVRCYGFRVVEPHADGCPHWHMMLFFSDREQAEYADRVVRHYWINKCKYGGERGADEYRVKTVWIDKERGRATGYIAKYIAKNIDGSHLEEDLYGNDAKAAAIRINAWAATHGIRQFQQIGGASVQVWRELRRMAEESISGVNSKKVKRMVKAATEGNWKRYVGLQGGAFVRRDAQVARLGYWWETDSRSTDVLLDSPVDMYGAENKGKIFGINVAGSSLVSRFYRWTIERVGKSVKRPVAQMWRLLQGVIPEWEARGFDCEDTYIDFMRGDGYA